MRDLDQLDAMMWSIMKPGVISIDTSKDYTFNTRSPLATSNAYSFTFNVKLHNLILLHIFQKVHLFLFYNYKHPLFPNENQAPRQR